VLAYFVRVPALAGGGKAGAVVDKALRYLLEHDIALFNLALNGGKIEL
jgi:hypothetical protein